MYITFIFLISGLVLVLLLTTKVLETKRQRSFMILTLISKGDIKVRNLSHELAHKYTEFKSKADFFLKRQLPLYSKTYFNKSTTFLREHAQLHIDKLRDSRLLKKSDGISEFFQNISNVDKGNGEIEETLDERFKNSDDVS